MSRNSNLDHRNIEFNSRSSSSCSDLSSDRLGTLSPITYTEQSYSQQISKILQLNIKALNSLKQASPSITPKVDQVLSSHYILKNSFEQVRKIEADDWNMVSQIQQVKHQLLLAHIELKQHKMSNNRLRHAIDTLQGMTVKTRHHRESVCSEDLNSYISTTEKEVFSDDDENDGLSELSTTLKELKSKDTLWKNFGGSVKQLIDEIDESKSSFPMLTRVRSMFNLLEVNPQKRHKDSFINHLIMNPGLIQHHFESLVEDISEKDQQISALKRENEDAQAKIDSLANANHAPMSKFNKMPA